MSPILFASLVGLQQIVCWGTLTYAAAVFAPAMAQACGISIASVMTAYGAGLLTNAIAAPALTRWVLRVGALVPAMVGLGLLMLACVLLSQAMHWTSLVAGFMVAGVAMALTQYDFAFLTVKLYLPNQARRVITMITFYGALASTIMWPAALLLSARLGPQMAWIALGLISVLLSLPAVLLAYRQRIDLPETEAEPSSGPDTAAPFQASSRWVLLGLIGFLLIGSGLVANLPLVLTQMHTPSGQTAWILSLFGIGQLFSRALDFAAGRWLSTRATVLTSSACLVVALALMALSSNHTATAAAFVFLLGCGNGLVTILRGVLPQQLFSGERFVHLSGQLARYGALGRALMPMLAAQALSLRGGLGGMSAVYGLVALLCGWILLQQIRASAT